MPGRNFLFIPGPTNVPRRIQNAMYVEQEDMRAMDLPEFTKPLYEDLKKVFKTKNGRIFIFPASGTGGWESAVSNTLNAGDKVLMSGFGHFSNLWIDLCQRWGLDVQALEVDWGEGVPVEKYAEILAADKNHEIKAVFATHNETATGVASDIAGIVCASEKALACRENSNLPKTFFDWNDQIKTNDLGYFPYTPPMNLLRGLRESVNILMEEGLENVFVRHNRMANAVRAAVSAWGMSPIAKEERWYSDTVTAVKVPEGFDGNEVVRHAYNYYNLALSISLAKIAGQAFRIGHLGDMNELMILTPITGAEMAMKDLKYPIELGSGVAAAQEYLRSTAKPKIK